MTCTTIQYIEASAYIVAGVCTALALGLEKLGHPLAATIVASLNGGALALKAYLSTSPKDTETVKTT